MGSYDIAAVYTNTDYEPYARERDGEITSLLAAKKIPFHSYKDQVLFDKDEVLKDDDTPYTVFTPYSRKWKSKMNEFYLSSYSTSKYHRQFNAARERRSRQFMTASNGATMNRNFANGAQVKPDIRW
jgi:deoxyribodipyrimidine photo-lyase